jgi:putative ABC transport system substrate-binding protein
MQLQGTTHATAGFHRSTRRRSSVAAGGSGAAAGGARTAHRRAQFGDENDPMPKTYVSAFSHAVADFGWTDGRNVRMDVRLGGGDINRIRPLAQELVGLQPDIILTGTTPTTVALQRETRTIPILFAGVVDPVATGIVTRLDRPGGNVTGFAILEPSLGGKWLELLSEIAPGLKRAAIMFHPDAVTASVYMPSLETAARSLNVVLSVRFETS